MKTKIVPRSFLRFIVIGAIISIGSTSVAIGLDIYQNQEKANLTPWLYVALGQVMGLGASAIAFNVLER